MKTEVRNENSLTRFPWWAWFFPEYALQETHTVRGKVCEKCRIPEIDLHVSNSIWISLFHQDERFLVRVETELGMFPVYVPPERFEKLEEGRQIEIDFKQGRHFAQDKRIVARIH